MVLKSPEICCSQLSGNISLCLSWLLYVLQERNMGQRLNVIIIAEGAIDYEGKAITPGSIKDVSRTRTAAMNYFVSEHIV